MEVYTSTPLVFMALCLINYSVMTPAPSHLVSKHIKIKIYKTIILPVVLYGCETWSFTLMKEHGLRVFENRVLRRIFEHKREE
jgi:hypothetical protein